MVTNERSVFRGPHTCLSSARLVHWISSTWLPFTHLIWIYRLCSPPIFLTVIYIFTSNTQKLCHCWTEVSKIGIFLSKKYNRLVILLFVYFLCCNYHVHTWIFFRFLLPFASLGRHGAVLHWDLLFRVWNKDSGTWFCLPQELLPEKWMECHGFCGGAHRVSKWRAKECMWHKKREKMHLHGSQHNIFL